MTKKHSPHPAYHPLSPLQKKKAIAWRTEFLVLRYCPFFPVRNYENPKTVKFR